jgi:hypothetical protein
MLTCYSNEGGRISRDMDIERIIKISVWRKNNFLSDANDSPIFWSMTKEYYHTRTIRNNYIHWTNVRYLQQLTIQW